MKMSQTNMSRQTEAPKMEISSKNSFPHAKQRHTLLLHHLSHDNPQLSVLDLNPQ